MNKIRFIFRIILCSISLCFWGCFSEENRENKVTGQLETQQDYIPNDSLSLSEYSSVHGFMPEDGLIPTAELAIQVAELVLKNIYGSENIEEQPPFFINLKNDIWIIEGNLDDGYYEGVAHIEIRKNNGEILKVIHGK